MDALSKFSGMTSVSGAPDSPWHAGEVAMQRSVGMAERMESIGRKVLRDYMPEQHREFYAQLPFVVLGTVDPQGRAWATLRAGRPGFLHAPGPRRLRLELAREPADPADAGLEQGDAVGMLGIELHTRRRNRLNGVVRRGPESGFALEVAQSFGNCPKYIEPREYAFVQRAPGPVVALAALDRAARALIGAADTFFVASYVDTGVDAGVVGKAGRQVDVSHRGGPPGFVRIDGAGTLTIPDYAGNLFFNTLGNFLLNPRAGLVFTDFASGDVLQLSGTVELLPDVPDLGDFPGAQRLWRFTPQAIVRRPAALPLRWQRGGGV